MHAHTLWRRILLGPSSRPDMWKERIRRARSCALDVALASESLSNTLYDIDTIAKQMHLLAHHLSRARSLDLRFDKYTPYLWNAALSPLCRPRSYIWDYRSPNPGEQGNIGAIQTTRLQSLILQYPQNDDTKEFTLFGGFAPRLARLTLEGVRLTWLPELFGNLVYLDYTHHGFSHGQEAIEEILSILQVSSQIRELRLCFVSRMAERQMLHLRKRLLVDEVMALPFLETLCLRVDNAQMDIPSELTSIVSRLSAPALKKLALQDELTRASGATVSPRRNHRSFVALPAFFKSLSSRLQERLLLDLSVEGRWLEPSLLSEFTTHMPLLEKIKVNGVARVLWPSGKH